MSRNLTEAAKRVSAMSYDEIQLFARHDPDIFRDVAAALVSKEIILRGEITSLVAEARSATQNGRVSYPSLLASQQIRKLVRRLADALEETERLRIKAP